FLGLDAGGVLELRQARVRPLVRVGTLPPVLASRADAGLEFSGLIEDTWLHGRQVHVPDMRDGHGTGDDPAWLGGESGLRTVVLSPLHNGGGHVRYLLGLVSLGRPKPLSERQLTLVSRAAEALGAALSRVVLNRQLFATLDVIGQLA